MRWRWLGSGQRGSCFVIPRREKGKKKKEILRFRLFRCNKRTYGNATLNQKKSGQSRFFFGSSLFSLVAARRSWNGEHSGGVLYFVLKLINEEGMAGLFLTASIIKGFSFGHLPFSCHRMLHKSRKE